MKNKSVLIRIIDVLTILLLLICLAGSVFIGFKYGVAGTHSFGDRIRKILEGGDGTEIIRKWKLILLALIPVLFLVFISAYRLIKKSSDRGKLIIGLVALAVMAVLQLVIAMSVSFIGNHDSYEVMDQALAIASGSQSQVNYSRIFYFQKYSNNNFFILLCVGVFKLARLFGVREYVRFMTVVNIIFMDLGIVFLVWAVRTAKDKTAASYVMLLNAINPLMYLFVGWNYTATMSILPMMASLFLLVLLNYRQMSTKKQMLFCAILGFTAAVSYLIRPTAFFIIVAYLVYRLIRIIGGYFSKKRLALFAASLVVFAVSFTGLGRASRALNPDQSKDFPVAHWIMIGADDNGRAKGNHSAFTKHFHTEEQMKTGDLERIKMINKRRGTKATVLHYMKKPILSWSDGAAEYYERFEIIKGADASVYSALAGEKSPWILVYCQAFRIVTLLLAIAGICVLIRKDDDMLECVVMITLFGAQFFYVIWEGKPAYSLPFIPLLLLQTLPAIERGTLKLKGTKALYAITAAAACVVIICQIPLTGQISTRMVPSVMTSRFRFRHTVKLAEGGELTQDFRPVNDFNRIEFPVHGDMDGYQISLMKDGTSIDGAMVSESDEKKKKICIDVPRQTSGDKYTILIKNDSDQHSSLHLKTSITDALVLYDGETTVNGKSLKDRLLINVTRK